MSVALLLIATTMILPSPARAQAELVADINRGNGPVSSGMPRNFVEHLGVTFFTACSRATGCELWVSVPGDATLPVTDICPGPCDADPSNLVSTPLGLLFSADDGQHGRELWLLDPLSGEPARMPAREYTTGPGHSDPEWMQVIPDPDGASAVVYVSFLDAIGTRQLARHSVVDDVWLRDGIEGGFSSIGPLIAQGERLLFAANRDATGVGSELWRIDTPGLLPILVRDIRPGSSGSAIRDLVAVPQRGGVFFHADDGISGREPWFSDGTAAGTRRLIDLAPGVAGSAPSEPVAFANGSVFFFANDAGTGANRDLWAVDGPALTARKVRDFGNGQARNLRAAAGGMVFTASDGVHGVEFWASGGFPQNTSQIVDLIPGSGGLTDWDAAVAGGFYYLAGGEQLYRTDGTAAGTRQVGHNSSAHHITSVHGAGGRVLFAHTDNFFTGTGTELYQSAVAAPNALGLVANIGDDVGHSHGGQAYVNRPAFFELAGGTVLFAFDEDEGLELRRLGPAGTASVVAPTQPGPGSLLFESSLDAATTRMRDGRLYFVDGQRSVWTSDGTTAGTRRLEQFGNAPFQASFVACLLPRGNGDLLVVTERIGGGVELWRVDAAGAPTQALLTPETMPADASLGSSARSCPVELGGQLLLRAFRPNTGFELFRSNLSPGHLVLVRDLAPGSADGLHTRVEPALAGGKLYFAGDSSGNGSDVEPWVSDGSAQGTFRLRDIAPQGGSKPHSFTAYGEQVVFAADGDLGRYHLWRSDGSSAGTVALTDSPGPLRVLLPATETGAVGRAIAVDGVRIFFAGTGTGQASGGGLYLSHGQPGDQRALEPPAATAPLAPQQLRTVPGAGVVFAGYQPESGRELWFSDGSADGTLLAADIATGPGHGGPHGITVLSDGVYFSADDGARGREPWRLPLPRAETIFTDGFD